MPRREDIKSIVLIGSGPIVIGQACEFDYSGTQACKALREEGYRVILVNSNPATIMTDPEMADAVYIEPLEIKTMEAILSKERPDAILPTMGGQTALNLALQLAEAGILEKYSVELLGVSQKAIEKAENRKYFDKAMQKIGLNTPRSVIVSTPQEVLSAMDIIGFPAIVRPSFTLGGTGGGVAYNREEFIAICKKGLELSPVSQLLIDESLLGWKEMEMEVVRDKAGNSIIVCSIENIDPMGIHTGDSITVAPAVTLTNREYQRMRDMSIAVLEEIGIESGAANVQFAINPLTGKIVVIEMNPRVSRSSALASKATGFPIASIATKLSIGYTLDELQNEIVQGSIPASFEPVLDYIVVKIPRFNFEKFPRDSGELSTQMRAVGEVMAMGTTFQEALQKALASMENGWTGLNTVHLKKGYAELSEAERFMCRKSIESAIAIPTSNRILSVGDAFRVGMSIEEVHDCTKIDQWFLYYIKQLIDIETNIKSEGSSILSNRHDLLQIKKMGFTDMRLAELLDIPEEEIRRARYAHDIHPVYKGVDSCAGEFRTETSYLYSTYFFEEGSSEVLKKGDETCIAIVGSGPNRIGQGIEFDYCCVHASLAIRSMGYKSIMINCNPETVSTDFDISDTLYFEPITLEHVLEIVRAERIDGIILQVGGQTPLKLANDLQKEGICILGTSPESIEKAENRKSFSELLSQIGLLQPKNATVTGVSEAVFAAKNIGYPVIIRPSYVLGGRAMQVVYTEGHLREYMQTCVSENSEILIDEFLDGAIEVDVDVIADGVLQVVGGVLEHIEEVGVHSGDSMCSFPPHTISDTLHDELREKAKILAKALAIVGFMNIQFAIYNGQIYVLEVNPRASRTVPFISKAIGCSLAQIATKAMVSASLNSQGYTEEILPKFFSIKVPVFPFDKFSSSDIILGPEMRSTGEVMGIGGDFGEAMYKGLLAAQTNMRQPNMEASYAFLSVVDQDKEEVVEVAKALLGYSFTLLATKGTASVLAGAGLPVECINKMSEGRPHIIDYIKNGTVILIVNSVTHGQERAARDAMVIRRMALQEKIPCILTLEGARAFLKAWQYRETVLVRHLQEIY
ncbi:MAG: carbamoyl-phosphate synthase large subunit [Desulfovibrionaceae bacterium]